MVVVLLRAIPNCHAKIQQNCLSICALFMTSSQSVELHPFLRASKSHSTLKSLQLFLSLVHPVSILIGWMQSWCAITPFFCQLAALYRIPDIGPFLFDELIFEDTEWSKDAHRECGWVTKELLDQVSYTIQAHKDNRSRFFINRKFILIIVWEVFGFFSRCGKVFPFSVDLFNPCGSLKAKNWNTIKIYISYDFLFINELHYVI